MRPIRTLGLNGSLLTSLLLALLISSVGELSSVPLDAWSVSALGLIIRSALQLVWVPFLLFGALVLAGPWGERSIVVPIGCGVLVAAQSYLGLTRYGAFAGYLPFQVLWALFGVFLGGCFVLLRPRSTVRIWQLAFACVLSIALAVATVWASSLFLDTRYPSLLHALFQVRFMACLLALLMLMRLGAWSATALTRLRAGSAGILCIALLAAWLRPASIAEQALVKEQSPAALAVSAHEFADEPCVDEPEQMSDAQAMALFARHSGLPALPAGFHVDDYNILLLTVESTRADHADLDDLASPFASVRHLAEAGAWVFDRAYAPATRTWLSISALFAMTFASHAAIDTRIPQWTGRLREEAETVAEVLAAEGYATRGLRHDFLGFEGLAQGFASMHLEACSVRPRELADRNLAGRTIDALAARQEQDGFFFLWSFLCSPHFPYLDSDGSTVEQYRRSVRHADVQVARILRFLRSSSLADSTIVILSADHGEEFYESGGRHGNSLLPEAIHIPLAVWIPGVRGGRIASPTSSMYVLPWLLSSARSPALRETALGRIRDDIAPMMASSEGAIVAEIFDANEDLLSLVWEDSKVDYSARSGRLVVSTPTLEDGRYPIAEPGSPQYTQAVERLHRLRKVRACHRRAKRTREPGEVRGDLRSSEAVPYQSRAER